MSERTIYILLTRSGTWFSRLIHFATRDSYTHFQGWPGRAGRPHRRLYFGLYPHGGFGRAGAQGLPPKALVPTFSVYNSPLNLSTVFLKSLQFLRSCTIRRKIQICETKLPMARQKIAGILCVFQDFLTQSAAILAAKICVEAIGTAF